MQRWEYMTLNLSKPRKGLEDLNRVGPMDGKLSRWCHHGVSVSGALCTPSFCSSDPFLTTQTEESGRNAPILSRPQGAPVPG